MSMKLIVALDFNHQQQALSLVDRFDPQKVALKVGSEMFTLFGADFVKLLVARQFKVFLDLKFHDIPNTVAQSCKAAADLGVWMMNLHASGGQEMMQAARKALEPYGSQKPLLIAVTVLTSMTQAQLPSIGIKADVMEQVTRLARLAHDAELDGVVCSAHEAAAIKAKTQPSWITVTPGIRLADDSRDDQSRIMTPAQAIEAGSDFLVIGRPITKAQNPDEVIDRILKQIV